MNHYIRINQVSKTIKTEKILDNICAEFESGKIYGIVGKNGSGKTMLFRVLSGLVKPTHGEIIVDQQTLYKDIQIIDRLGLIIENEEMDPSFTGIENLILLAGIKHRIKKEQIISTMKMVGLDPNDKRTYKKYSLGMRQKMSIAQAIMENPDFLLLDEPTNGLDDESIMNFYHIMKTERDKGKVIVIASHSKEMIAELCDECYEMKQGTLKRLELENEK